jgi:4-amino-4-deoxy-L-arabinose transferase-like glycosyltransferase
MITKKKLLPVILTFFIICGFAVRFYRFDNPIADWHSWRQADTSAVSRNFVNKGFDILRPRFDDLSNVPSGKDNPNGYRFVEFPIYNIAQAGFYKLFGVFTLEEWGRLVSIFSSILSSVFLYFIVSRHSKKSIGLWSSFFYLFIPYNIYYGRTILPDTSMVMASLGGIYFFDLYLNVIARSAKGTKKQSTEGSKLSMGLPRSFFARNDKRYLFFLLAIIFTASAFLLKPYALFFTLPMIYLVWKRFGFGALKKWQLWIFLIISVAPLVWWRWWMGHYPEGIPVNQWLLNGNGIRFRPAFFRWILYERLTKLISGYLGVIILLFGLLQMKAIKEWGFFVSFLLSSLLYVVIFATGNVQHDYYQILIMPSVSICFALGSYFLFHWTFKNLPIGKIILVGCLISLFWFGWKQVHDYFNINNRAMIAAGEAVDTLTPKDAKVIANYIGDTSFLYQTKRQGWASFEKPIPEMIKMGADYLILLNPSKQDYTFGKPYKIVESTPQYVIFKLR